MAAEKKKPTRRSVKGAKRVGSSAKPIDSAVPVVVSEDPIEQEPVDFTEEVQPEAVQPDQIPMENETSPVRKSVSKPVKKQVTKSEKKKLTPKNALMIALKVFLAVVVIAAVAAIGLFSWDRWFRYDDATDFLGQWSYVEGAVEVPVVIGSDSMRINNEVDYDYSVDPWAKTVTFAFTDLEGEAHYRFSEDRSTIYICENADSVDWIVEIQLALGLVEETEGFDPEATIYLKHG